MPEKAYFLASRRLGFRLWHQEDLALAIALWGDFEVTKLFDGRGPLSDAQVEERLHKEISQQVKHGVQYWPIFNLNSRRHVGCAGLRPYHDEEKILEIGFHIRSDCWRKGYAHEAARAVIDYAFRTKRADSLFAGHNPNNTASGNLLAKLGFKFTHYEYYAPTGLQHPSYLFTKDMYTNQQ